MKSKRAWICLVLLVATLAIGSPASADSPWVSVPSTPDESGKVVIAGGNLAPFSTIALSVSDASGATTIQLETTGAEGTFAATYLPSVPGSYRVKVTDQNGTEVGGGAFGYIQ